MDTRKRCRVTGYGAMRDVLGDMLPVQRQYSCESPTMRFLREQWAKGGWLMMRAPADSPVKRHVVQLAVQRQPGLLAEDMLAQP